jgi:hypothetical protein
VSRDPIGEKGGWNLSAFLRNRPSDAVDPDGLLDYAHTSATVSFDRTTYAASTIGGSFIPGAFTGGTSPSLVPFSEWSRDVNVFDCSCGYECYTYAPHFFRVTTFQTLLVPVPGDAYSAAIAGHVNGHEARRLLARTNANGILQQAEQKIWALWYTGITEADCLGKLSTGVTRLQLAAKDQWISFNTYHQGKINIENSPGNQVFTFEGSGGTAVLKTFAYVTTWTVPTTSFSLPADLMPNEQCR